MRLSTGGNKNEEKNYTPDCTQICKFPSVLEDESVTNILIYAWARGFNMVT